MIHIRIGPVFLVFFAFSAFAKSEEPATPTVKIICSGKGELNCNETLKCEDKEYQDVRMGSTGCCQKCVHMLVEGERCPDILEEVLPDARCATGLNCQEGVCVKHVYEVVEITYTPIAQ